MTRRSYPWDEWTTGELLSVDEAEAPHLASALRTKAARLGRKVRTRRVVEADGRARVLFQFEPEDGRGFAPALDRAGAVDAVGACPTCGAPRAPQSPREVPATEERPGVPAEAGEAEVATEASEV